MYDLLIAPFHDYDFMRRALVACFVLALGGAPLGVLMNLRRMTLVGDAMAHAILPGVAVAFMFFGFSVVAMLTGGLVVGILVSTLATLLVRHTNLKEDSSLALIYLMSLATGVVIVSLRGNAIDLLHLLFGSILAINNSALYLIAASSTITLFVILGLFRSFVISSFDPSFAHIATRGRDASAFVFPVLMAINLISAFQAMGTLMSLGLIILPAINARFWAKTVDQSLLISMGSVLVGAPLGLLISYHANLASGPCIVLILGGFCILSALVKALRRA